MATKKTSASKTSGKAASKKRKTVPAPKKAAPQKDVSKKITAKKTLTKRAAVKKTAVKKVSAKKAVIKKASLKKASLKKASVKKSSAKKTASKSLTAKKPVTKAAIEKIIAKKPDVKIASKKMLLRKPAVKKTVLPKPVPRPAPKIALPRVSPSKTANSSVKKRARQNTLNFNPPPVSPPRRPASVIPRTKTIKEPLQKLAASVRAPVRANLTPRRAARSAARGMAPGAVQTSAPIDQKPRQNRKPQGLIDEALSEQKLREAIRTAVLYLEAWLKSSGADVTPAIAELAAPAEAARAQIWRWLDREAHFGDGRVLTGALLEDALDQEMHQLRKDVGEDAFDTGLFVTAAQLFLDLALAPDFDDFPGAAARLFD